MNQVTLTLKITETESAEKSAESADSYGELIDSLSIRQREILDLMERDKPYSAQEIADVLGLKRPRTRQLLNELISLNLVYATASTKNRRYVKK